LIKTQVCELLLMVTNDEVIVVWGVEVSTYRSCQQIVTDN